MRDYYKQLYSNKMDNLEEMDKFLEKHSLSTLNQEEIENMNRPITSTEVETRVKNLPTGASLVAQWLRVCCQCRVHGLNAGLGGSHMPRSSWACEPQLLSLRIWSLCSATRGHDSERPTHRHEEWPLLTTTGESPRTEKKMEHSQK